VISEIIFPRLEYWRSGFDPLVRRRDCPACGKAILEFTG
jgi:hypothetical protein